MEKLILIIDKDLGLNENRIKEVFTGKTMTRKEISESFFKITQQKYFLSKHAISVMTEKSFLEKEKKLKLNNCIIQEVILNKAHYHMCQNNFQN